MWKFSQEKLQKTLIHPEKECMSHRKIKKQRKYSLEIPPKQSFTDGQNTSRNNLDIISDRNMVNVYIKIQVSSLDLFPLNALTRKSVILLKQCNAAASTAQVIKSSRFLKHIMPRSTAIGTRTIDTKAMTLMA